MRSYAHPGWLFKPSDLHSFVRGVFAFWTIALKKLKKELSAKYIPYMAMAAAFSFLVMMFNIPVPGGTTGHAVEQVLSRRFGPWTAVIAVSMVLIIQALVFGDGGITAIGANCFNMAIVIPFVSYWTFKLVQGNAVSGRRISAAAFLSGYCGLSVASIITAVELAHPSPLLLTPPTAGRSMLHIRCQSQSRMALEHLLLFGVVEGTITTPLFKYFVKHEPGLVYVLKTGKDSGLRLRKDKKQHNYFLT